VNNITQRQKYQERVLASRSNSSPLQKPKPYLSTSQTSQTPKQSAEKKMPKKQGQTGKTHERYLEREDTAFQDPREMPSPQRKHFLPHAIVLSLYVFGLQAPRHSTN
jgi:hypothetical protein